MPLSTPKVELEVELEVELKVEPRDLPVAEVKIVPHSTPPVQTFSVSPQKLKPATLIASLQAPIKEENPPRMVTVVLHSTGESVKDQRRIQRLHGAFISSPGRDHFTLHIKENGRAFLMEFPNDTTHICPQLLDDIKKIVAEIDIHIEPILFH